MNSRDTIPLSELSRGRWADEPLEPPPHPDELKPAARVRSRVKEPAPLARMWTWFNEQTLLARMQSWLNEQALLAKVRTWIDERAPFARMWSSLAGVDPVTFARYLTVFFIGVFATVVWQSYLSGTKEETAAATQAALVSMQQSIDKLAVEITRIRTVERDILDRISAPPPQPQQVAAPARSPAQRSSPVR